MDTDRRSVVAVDGGPFGGHEEPLFESRGVFLVLADFLEQGDLPLGGAADGAAGLFAREEARRVETGFRYEGYLAQQERQIERLRRAEMRRIPESFDYARVPHLRMEAREKLTRVRPLSLAQAGRISGITPADLAVLMVHLQGASRVAVAER